MNDHNYLYYSPIAENDRILILGAAGGDFIKEHFREILAKNAFVINVEPTFEGVTELAKFIKSYMPENACIVSAAVSNYSTLEEMEIRDNLITSTLVSRPETNARWPMRLLYKTKVPVFTLDTLIMMADRVDKIFCDIEGSELEVFYGCNLLDLVPYYAVAAYHVRDSEPTWKPLSAMFSNRGFSTKVDGEASIRKEEAVLFAWKEK